jgi:hypothetical protein
VRGGKFGSFGFACGLACGQGQNQMCQMWDSQNAIGEKVRLGKNLNICVGLSVGIFLSEVCQVEVKSQKSKSIFNLFALCGAYT